MLVGNDEFTQSCRMSASALIVPTGTAPLAPPGVVVYAEPVAKFTMLVAFAKASVRPLRVGRTGRDTRNRPALFRGLRHARATRRRKTTQTRTPPQR